MGRPYSELKICMWEGSRSRPAKKNLANREQREMDRRLGFIRSWSIRGKLLCLLLIVFLPAFAIIVTSGLSHRRDEIRKAENSALLLVQSLAAQQEQIVTSTKVMLSTLAQFHELRSLDSEACNVLFRQMHDRYPFYSVILAVTPDGNVFAASMPFKPGNINLAYRKHIKDVIRTLDFSSGEYNVGRVSNMVSFNFAHPVFDDNKNLIAIVIAGFNLDEYARFVSKVNLPEDCAIVITDHNGVRLYRYPATEETAPGVPIPADPFKLASGDSEEGIFERLAQDGIERVYAFKQLRLHGNSRPYMYMLVGLGKNQIFRKADIQMLWNLSILGIAAFVGLSCGVVFRKLRLRKANQTFGLGCKEIRRRRVECSNAPGLPPAMRSVFWPNLSTKWPLSWKREASSGRKRKRP